MRALKLLLDLAARLFQLIIRAIAFEKKGNFGNLLETLQHFFDSLRKSVSEWVKY
jgi:hypothetical protein